jgi:uncharacterized damage-inducible protein DinB
MRSLLRIGAALAAAAIIAVPLAAQDAAKKQEAPKRAPGPAQDAVDQWNYIGKKLIEMAEDFPEDKYDYKPTPEVRSFAQQLLHVAAANQQFTAAAKGEKLNPEEELPRAQYKTKADVVNVLKSSFADGAAIMKQKGDKGIMGTIKNPYGNVMTTIYSLALGFAEHSGEHYGQLVVYYRINGMVPPDSRPKK